MQNVTIPSLATIRLGKAIIFSTSLLYISSSFDTTLLISHTSTPGRHSTVVTAMALMVPTDMANGPTGRGQQLRAP